MASSRWREIGSSWGVEGDLLVSVRVVVRKGERHCRLGRVHSMRDVRGSKDILVGCSADELGERGVLWYVGWVKFWVYTSEEKLRWVGEG